MDEYLFETTIGYRKIYKELTLKKKNQSLTNLEKQLLEEAQNVLYPSDEIIIRINLQLIEEMGGVSFDTWLENGSKIKLQVIERIKND